MDGSVINYLYGAPAGHFWQQHITHKVRERTLRETYFYPNIKFGDVFLDIGAAYGSWAIPAAILGAYVYAFEPRLDVAQNLDANFALNGLTNNYLVVNAAVSDAPGVMDMCTSGNSTTIRQNQNHVACMMHSQVGVVTIDSIVRDISIPHVDWMKVDAEGVELQVLQGAMQTILSNHPNIIVECHQGHDNNTLDSVLAFMQSLGLSYYLYVGNFGWFSSDRPHAIFLRS